VARAVRIGVMGRSAILRTTMQAARSTANDVTVAPTGDVAYSANYWPINWSSIWVGTLAALAVALVFSLVGAALGAHQVGPGGRIARWSDVGLGALAFAVCGAFFSFVVGGWLAAKINGYRKAETDMLHGAIVWLVALPIIVVLAALGGGTLFGVWFGGLGMTPVWVTSNAVSADPAAATRNAALAALTALLIGLVGSVIGGWMASGEPMTLTLHRNRTANSREAVRRTL
jgi:hypothetical protein